MSNTKLTWDGEKIKRTIKTEETKFTPKDLLNSLNQVRGQINQMKNQELQLEGQMKQAKNQMRSAKDFEAELKPFEEKCRELQVAKLKEVVSKVSKECQEKAEKSSAEVIAKDPEAYNEDQKERLPYLDFQKNLATNEKVAEKISQHIIREFLYETPVFSNPFKK